MSKAKSLRCPECGFKAAHAMGLGRHRSAQHGVISQRELARRANGRARAGNVRATRELRAVNRRLTDLEHGYDRLTRALRSAAKASRR